MKRLPILAVATLAATASLTLPAFAGGGRALQGTVTSLTSTAISISGRGGIVTTCRLGRHSPSTAKVAVGDRVRAVCERRRHRGLVLTKLRTARTDKHHDNAAPSKDTEPVKFGGAITALTDTSISLHDGDRDLTCTIGPASPPTADFKVGVHVKVACAGGMLVAIAAVTTADAGRYFAGTVATLTDGAITLDTEHGQVTCTITAESPSTAELKTGDKVGIGCRASTMELVLLKRLTGDDTPPPPTHIELHARGAIAELGEHGLAVTADGGRVACTTGEHSPSLDGYVVGDAVAISCVDGVLTAIERLEPTG